MVEAVQRSLKARRGDAWEGEAYRLVSATPGFWSGASAKCQIRKTETSPVSHEFSLSPVVTQEGANTVLTVELGLSEYESARLAPGTYFGDLEVRSTLLPKSTIVQFTLEVFGDITRMSNA